MIWKLLSTLKMKHKIYKEFIFKNIYIYSKKKIIYLNNDMHFS
jgi:hypothetical protein